MFSTGADVGGLGTPALVTGNLLRSFNGWLSEDGDPSFSISFAKPITSFSADLAGISAPSSSWLFTYNGLTLLSTASAASSGQATLGFSSGTCNRVVSRQKISMTGSAWTTLSTRPCRRSALTP